MKTRDTGRSKTKAAITAFMVLSAAFGAFSEVVIDAENFIIRQQWPWSGKVQAEFMVEGTVTAPGATAKVNAYDGDKLICEIPSSQLEGDVVITAGGKKSISFNPSAVPAIKERGIIKDFRLGIEYVDGTVDYNSPNILYVIFDLENKGQVQVLTENDITGGSSAREGTGMYGAWKRRYWDAGADTVAWLGVNAEEYKTTKLVFRHIPGHPFVMGSPDDEPGRFPNEEFNGTAEEQLKLYGYETRHKVTLSGYYIGVFELTQKQWKLLAGDRQFTNGVGSDYPAQNVKYTDIRGGDAPGKAITESSFIGRLQAFLGSAYTVDLPTEAQWEAACRAGTDTGLYSGRQLPSDPSYYQNGKTFFCADLAEIAVYFLDEDNKAITSVLPVGGRKPHNYGLFDMIGNAGEICLDKFSDSKSDLGSADASDPVFTGSGQRRAFRGGTVDAWISYQYGLAAFRSAARGSIQSTDNQRQYGFRVAMKIVVPAAN